MYPSSKTPSGLVPNSTSPNHLGRLIRRFSPLPFTSYNNLELLFGHSPCHPARRHRPYSETKNTSPSLATPAPSRNFQGLAPTRKRCAQGRSSAARPQSHTAQQSQRVQTQPNSQRTLAPPQGTRPGAYRVVSVVVCPALPSRAMKPACHARDITKNDVITPTTSLFC